MLDRSVPYAGLFMRRRAGTPIPEFPLPDGFSFAFFSDGCEKDWARIETSVLEFESEFAALLFFKENFMPYAEELNRRCLFIENAEGEKIATATAWWAHVDGRRRPWVHWVGVVPAYQGMGLGKAVMAGVTKLMVLLEGEAAIYLKTQTWSYRAIGVYKECGYLPTDEKILYKAHGNTFKKALRILKRLGRKGLYRE